MNAVAIFAALIVVTNEGKVSVQDNLSDHACKEASCIAMSGADCETVERVRLQQQKDADADAKAHPKSRWRVGDHCTVVDTHVNNNGGWNTYRCEEGDPPFSFRPAPPDTEAAIARCVK